MFQYLAGDLFVYIDTLLTIDEIELKSEKQLMEYQEIMTAYLEMFLKWLSLAPLYFEWATPLYQNKNLHLVSPEAAIIKLGANFI